MFTINIKHDDDLGNCPKYIIITDTGNVEIYDSDLYDSFYYVLIGDLNFLVPDGVNIPKFIVSKSFYFNLVRSKEKFDLSKLGTDYLITFINTYVTNECKNNLPENYINRNIYNPKI